MSPEHSKICKCPVCPSLKGGQTPSQLVKHHEGLQAFFAEWDCAETDKLVAAFAAKREAAEEERVEAHRKELGDLDSQVCVYEIVHTWEVHV